MTEPATVSPTDPNRRRRAVIRIPEDLIHDLLHLPPDVEVRWVKDNWLRGCIDVMVTSPDLPVLDAGAHPPDLKPSYDRIDDRPVLVDTGISAVLGAKRWEWSFRYPDTGPVARPGLTEAEVRREAAHDLSIIILRREPGTTEWEEAPA